MKITKNSKITVHGWQDWIPTYREFIGILNTFRIGANQNCDVTIDGVTKTMVEWQMEWQKHLEV